MATITSLKGKTEAPTTALSLIGGGDGGLVVMGLRSIPAAKSVQTITREAIAVRAAIFRGPRDIVVGERPDPVIQEPTDAIVRVVLACVCGSDLWYYRGESPHAVGSIGHEFIGVVEETGAEVSAVAGGDLVVAPFIYSDMSCPHCLNGSTISCVRGGNFGNGTIDGGQGQAVRVPLAGSTLVRVPAGGHSEQTLRSLLTLSDVMATGRHAALSGGVRPGNTVAVVGDGAIGLSAILAARRLGADRIIALSRHPDRQVIAKEFGATDIVEARGDAATEAVMDMTGGIGADASLECVGTAQSIATAFAIARPGSTVGMVGVPHGDVPAAQTFFRNVGGRGGPAPARIYIPELLDEVLDGAINPGLVFDYETDLDHVADAYAAMDDAGPSSPSSGSDHCERLDRRRAAAHRRRTGTAPRGSPPGRITTALHNHVGRPGRERPVRPFRRGP